LDNLSLQDLQYMLYILEVEEKRAIAAVRKDYQKTVMDLMEVSVSSVFWWCARSSV